MAFFRHYQCPECQGVFKFLHERNDVPPPDRCGLCNAWMLDEPDPVFVPQAPMIGTQKGRSPDQVYRQMEEASAARTELMAQAGGGSASDYSHTKITDMNDDRHEGEVAAKYAPSQAYLQELQRLNQAPPGFSPVASVMRPEHAAIPLTGTATRDRIASSHAQIARAVEREGRINKN